MLYTVFVTMVRTYERWLIVVGNRTTSCESMVGFLVIPLVARKAIGGMITYKFVLIGIPWVRKAFGLQCFLGEESCLGFDEIMI